MAGEYQRKCPDRGYHYQLVSISEQDWEICPICGCSKPFSDFVERKFDARATKVPE